MHASLVLPFTIVHKRPGQPAQDQTAEEIRVTAKTGAQVTACTRNYTSTGAVALQVGDVVHQYFDPADLGLGQDVALAGVISPTQIVANTDNYNPTGLSAASVLRLSTDASRNITGLAGGASGRLILIHNVGSFNIVLKDSVTSDADKQFALTADVTLTPDAVALLQYDATTQRWRMVGGSGSSISYATTAELADLNYAAESAGSSDTTARGDHKHAIPNVAGNLLLNGGFDFFQRQTPGSLTAYTDGQYSADRWYVLTETAGIQAQRDTGDATLYAITLKQNQAAAQRFGLAQVIENQFCRPYRSRAVNLQLKAKASGTLTLRYAILEWTGTADSPVKDVVNDWTNSTYTAGQFFKSTTTNVLAVGSVSIGVSFTELNLPATLGASANNVYVFFWTESQISQNVTVTITEAQLNEGTSSPDWTPRHVGLELRLCQRYYQKSCSIDTAAVDGGGSLQPTGGTAFDTGNVRQTILFKVHMRTTTPTVVLFRGSNGASAGKWAYYVGGWADPTSNSAVISDETGFAINLVKAATFTAGYSVLTDGLWTAETELGV
jgi:hypothetical protein